MKIHHLTFGLATGLATFAVPTALRAQNLIQNGSFELGVLSSSSYTLQSGDSADAPSSTNWLEGWSFTISGNAIIHHKNPGNWQDGSDGNQYIRFGSGNGTLWQNVDLVAGTSYHLSFDVMKTANEAFAFNYEFYTAGDEVFNGSYSIPDPRREWHTVELDFTADLTASYTFAVNNGSGLQFRIDNVSLTAVAVPEPAAFAALAGLGVLALAATRRRRA